MEATVFRGLTHKSYDIAVVWDYTDVTEDISGKLSGYDEICVIGWSFGVFAASLVLDDSDRRITSRIAVNGTLTPVHDEEGIPERIFYGTLNGMNERNLEKFRRRMCGSPVAYEALMAKSLSRDLKDLTEELMAFGDRCKLKVDFRWDVAVVGMRDAIFPPAAQIRAWMNKARIEQMDEAHFPDFEGIIKRHIIDKNLVEERFSLSKATYSDNAEVQTMMARRLFNLANPFLPSNPRRVLEIGCGTGILSRLIGEHYPRNIMTLWDLVDYGPFLPEYAVFKRCDAETELHSLPDESESMIFSSATMQWFNSPCAFLREIARVLEPGGIAAVSSFSPDNMLELAELSGVRLRLPSLAELEEATEGCIDVLVAEAETEVMKFTSPHEVLRHIRATGVNGLLSGANESTAAARKLINNYQPADDGFYHLTYKPIYLVLGKRY